MTDEFLVDPDEHAMSIVPLAAERPLPSELRADPRFVEPVRIEIDADTAAVRETVEHLRDELFDRFGFVPREIDVAPCNGGWRLVIDGELVERSPTIGRDARGALAASLSRHLWRMLRMDDTADLVSFARIAAPVTVDRAMPHNVTIEQLHRVLRDLLRDGLPIKPLDRIIDVLAEAPHHDRDATSLVEHVRMSRRRTIVQRSRQPDGELRVLELSTGATRACHHLALDPVQPGDRRARFLARLRRDLGSAAAEHRLDPPVITCASADRPVIEAALRDLDAFIVSRAELFDVEVSTVALLGEGIVVPVPEPTGPPPPVGGDWLHHPTNVGSHDGVISDVVVIN